MIDMETVIAKTDEVVLADLDGKVVMMSIENGQYYGLDEVGSAIWGALSEPIKLKALLDKLMEEYEVSREECEKDVIAFLEKLREKKLIMTK